MKEDYIWDKTGRDPDVERLEELLSVLRFKDHKEAAAHVIEFPSKTKRNLQPWIFAMAACVALAAAALAAWNLSMNAGDPPPVQMAVNIDEDGSSESAISNIDRSEASISKVSIPSPQRAVALKKRSEPLKRKYAAVSRKRQERSKLPALTEEEKYAYGQLMLALSITSSKWQVVQESINGVEEVSTNER